MNGWMVGSVEAEEGRSEGKKERKKERKRATASLHESSPRKKSESRLACRRAVKVLSI